MVVVVFLTCNDPKTENFYSRMVYFEKQIESDLRTKVRCSKCDLTVKDRNLKTFP